MSEAQAEHQPIDSAVHRAVLLGFIQQGHPPGAPELARQLSAHEREAHASLDRLHANHGLVLHPGTHEIWVAHPFAASPTPFYVEPATSDGSARGWWASCIWCACGITALIGGHARIHSRLSGEHEPVTVDIHADEVSPPGLIAHFPIPVARAWDNVHHFCASTLVFDSERSIDRWCARHGYPRGDALPLPRLVRFARDWYGNHLAPDWRKPTIDQARAMFKAHGLTNPTWALPGGGDRF